MEFVAFSSPCGITLARQEQQSIGLLPACPVSWHTARRMRPSVHRRRVAVTPQQQQISMQSGGGSGGGSAREFVEEQVGRGGVVVFSKSRCPYCSTVKSVLRDMGAEGVVVHELDKMKDGRAVQDELQEMTGQRTVPNVFIGGEHIGGCDDTMSLGGELSVKLKAAGVKLG